MTQEPDPPSVRLDSAVFDSLFPFHLVVDDALRVVRAGPALRRLIPALEKPAQLAEHFTVRRPVIKLDFPSLADKRGTIVLLAAKSPQELVLRGEIVPFEGKTLAFLGSPWLTNLDALGRYGLTISDFAIHDSISDLLILLQTQKTALDDAQKLAMELRGARDAALQASRFKSELLANMSHELRTPLNAIIGFSDLLSTRGAAQMSKPYPEYVGFISKSGRALLDLVNDLLDLSRIEAGRYELVESNVQIAPALEECLNLVIAQAQAKGVDLAFDPGPAGLILHADPRAFRQIVINLLSNAVKFNNANGHVKLAASRAKGDGDLTVSVSDTGIGIAPDVIPRLFEPFRQASTGISRQYGGTGLGLSICRNLVELHGGRIGLQSDPGKGTTATVTFPARRIVEPA